MGARKFELREAGVWIILGAVSFFVLTLLFGTWFEEALDFVVYMWLGSYLYRDWLDHKRLPYRKKCPFNGCKFDVKSNNYDFTIQVVDDHMVKFHFEK